jgi:hypothetical protein
MRICMLVNLLWYRGTAFVGLPFADKNDKIKAIAEKIGNLTVPTDLTSVRKLEHPLSSL